MKNLITVFILIAVLAASSCKTPHPADGILPVKIYDKNPFFWEYKGEPVLLLGGSREDNLFNHPEGLADHLDLLQSVGGNYIRNTMSSRNPGNLWPFNKLENGRYDLGQWNDDYWARFENLLRLSVERDIIVQVEIWDPWDLFKSEAALGHGPLNTGWESSPYNPLMNINYTAEISGLAIEIDYYTAKLPSEHKFFYTVPELENNLVVRQYQEALIDKLLSISLKYPNVLYCMNNETGEPAQWSAYWAKYIRNKANKAGREVFLADMRRNSNFSSDEQIKLLHDREHYDFFEISQNNANAHQEHYDFILSIRDQIIDDPKPLSNIKVYGGGESAQSASVIEGTRRFWRNIFGGTASTRFHRQGTTPFYHGAGLSDLSQAHIRSMRALTDEMDVFNCTPSNHLLNEREPNEAYCLAQQGKQYAVYFTDGGEVLLDLSAVEGKFELRWLDISNTIWQESIITEGTTQVKVTAPGKGQWVALILPLK
jgi:hypothetical protein